MGIFALVPLLATIGITGTAAMVVSAVVVVAADVGLAIGISAIAKALAPKPGIRGSTLQVSLNANDPRRVLVGEVCTAGALVTFQSWGNNNEYIVLLFRVADHLCGGLVSVYWNGGLCTVNPSTGAISQFYADGHDNCWVSFADGDWNQAADPDMVANSGGRWTSNSRGRGVAYVKIKARFNATAFPGGVDNLFQFVFLIKGAALYDRRLDGSVGGSGAQRWDDQSTWAYNANSAVITENFLRGFRAEDTGTAVGSRKVDYFAGLNLTDAQLPFNENTTAMNHCDEAVSLLAGGSEPRYQMGGVVTCDQTSDTILSDFLATMAGKLLTAPNRYIMLPGVAQSAVRTFQDTDLRLDGPFQYTNDIALDTIANAVVGQFLDPLALYSPQPLPPRISLSDVAEDGGYKADTLDLSYVTSETQGQRCQEIHRQRSRRQRSGQITVAPENIDLEAGDWIVWNSARFAANWGGALTFEILQAQPKATDQEEDMLQVVLSLQEVDADVFGWTPSVDELSRTDPVPLPSADPTAVVIAGFAVITSYILGPTGEQIPMLTIECNALTDPTIVGLDIQYQAIGLPPAAPQTLSTSFPINPATQVGTQVFTITEGLVAGYDYEARGAVVRNPAQALHWTAWTYDSVPAPGTVAGTIINQGDLATLDSIDTLHIDTNAVTNPLSALLNTTYTFSGAYGSPTAAMSLTVSVPDSETVVDLMATTVWQSGAHEGYAAYIYRDSTLLLQNQSLDVSIIAGDDQPGPGTYTYYFMLSNASGASGSITVLDPYFRATLLKR